MVQLAPTTRRFHRMAENRVLRRPIVVFQTSRRRFSCHPVRNTIGSLFLYKRAVITVIGFLLRLFSPPTAAVRRSWSEGLCIDKGLLFRQYVAIRLCSKCKSRSNMSFVSSCSLCVFLFHFAGPVCLPKRLTGTRFGPDYCTGSETRANMHTSTL